MLLDVCVLHQDRQQQVLPVTQWAHTKHHGELYHC